MAASRRSACAGSSSFERPAAGGEVCADSGLSAWVDRPLGHLGRELEVGPFRVARLMGEVEHLKAARALSHPELRRKPEHGIAHRRRAAVWPGRKLGAKV